MSLKELYVTLTIKGKTIKLKWLSLILSLKLQKHKIIPFNVLQTSVCVASFEARH